LAGRWVLDAHYFNLQRSGFVFRNRHSPSLRTALDSQIGWQVVGYI